MRLSNRTRKRLAELFESAVVRALASKIEYSLTSPFGRVLPPAMHERLRVLRYKYPFGVVGALQQKRVLEMQREFGEATRSVWHSRWRIPLLCSKYIQPNSALIVNIDGVDGPYPSFVIYDEMGEFRKDQWDRAAKKPDPMEVD